MEVSATDRKPPVYREKRFNRWVWVVIAAVIGPIISCIVMAAVMYGSINIYMKAREHRTAGIDDEPDLSSVWSYGHGKTKIVRIPVRGVLISNETVGLFSEPGPVDSALRQIRTATKDSKIKAIILEIDSPGGAITACDLIYKALLDFKAADSKRKVVAIFGDIAASGGYYVAAAADYIIAQPTTLTGSIGVIISKLNIEGLGEKYGIKMEVIKSGDNKDVFNLFETMTDEQRKLIQEVVDEMHNRFVLLVANGRRNLTVEDVMAIADGRVFTGTKALEYKLVDEIGYWSDALDKTCELLDVDDVKVMRYYEHISFSSLLMGLDVPKLLQGRIMDATRPQMLYMWRP